MIGFVGTGGIARTHMDALAAVPDARVLACTDVDPDRAAEAAARFAGAGAYTDHRRMLDAQELDAAYVCVPPHAHGEVELALIERGIPFFVEKPVGNDRETPQRVLDALEGKGLITSVGYVMRYIENARRARDHLAEHPPVLARGIYAGGLPGAAWWRRKEQSGGQVNEQSTHLVDLARYLFGEVRSVFCAARRGLITDVEGYSVEDASLCTLAFESGMIAELASTCAVEQGEVSLEVFTRTSRLRLDTWRLNLTLTRSGEAHSYETGEDPYLREDRAFVEAVLDGDASGVECSYADAFRTQRVTCAANESMESGQPAAP